jgi:hypothetical protein
MYDPYRPARPDLKERLKKTVLFAAVVAAFGATVALLAFLSGIPSSRDKQKYKEWKEKAGALVRDVPVVVTAAGFVRRQVGGQELYVPALSVLVSNASSRTIEDVELRAWFEGERPFYCRGYARFFRLRPGETSEATLSCIEPTAFGTVVQGVPLWQMSRPMRYGVTVIQNRVSAEVANGLLSPKILTR